LVAVALVIVIVAAVVVVVGDLTKHRRPLEHHPSLLPNPG
jgi:hypothetical protein